MGNKKFYIYLFFEKVHIILNRETHYQLEKEGIGDHSGENIADAVWGTLTLYKLED